MPYPFIRREKRGVVVFVVLHPAPTISQSDHPAWCSTTDASFFPNAPVEPTRIPDRCVEAQGSRPVVGRSARRWPNPARS